MWSGPDGYLTPDQFLDHLTVIKNNQVGTKNKKTTRWATPSPPPCPPPHPHSRSRDPIQPTHRGDQRIFSLHVFVSTTNILRQNMKERSGKIRSSPSSLPPRGRTPTQ